MTRCKMSSFKMIRSETSSSKTSLSPICPPSASYS